MHETAGVKSAPSCSFRKLDSSCSRVSRVSRARVSCSLRNRGRPARGPTSDIKWDLFVLIANGERASDRLTDDQSSEPCRLDDHEGRINFTPLRYIFITFQALFIEVLVACDTLFSTVMFAKVKAYSPGTLFQPRETKVGEVHQFKGPLSTHSLSYSRIGPSRGSAE